MRNFLIKIFSKKEITKDNSLRGKKYNDLLSIAIKQRDIIKQLDNNLAMYKQAFEIKQSENKRLKDKCDNLQTKLLKYSGSFTYDELEKQLKETLIKLEEERKKNYEYRSNGTH